MLERYGHGGDLRTASEAYGLPEEAFLDFSSNMNPFGPPDAVRRELLKYADEIAHYPDPAVRGLRRKLALRHGIDEASVLIGNGAAELIDLAVREAAPASAGLAEPGFGEYADAVTKSGGRIAGIALRPEEGFELTAAALERSAAVDAGFYLLGSPNNPTGRLLDPAFVLGLVRRGENVVVDEAFLDFVPEEAELSLVREAAVHPNLLVIRSMTKFYAIPGIRLGYAVGAPERIAGLRRLQVPWSVNSLAQRIGEAVLDDAAYAERTIRWLAEERPWLAGRLECLGLRVFPSAANYLLVRLPEAAVAAGMTSGRLQREMGRRGVLVRDASRFAGLDEAFLRLAVKLRSGNERMLEALEECLATGESEGGRG